MTPSPLLGSSSVGLRDLETYVFSTRYVDGEFDCVDLVVRVQRELFGRHVGIESARERSAGVRGHARYLQMALGHFVEKTEAPVAGDVVLLWETTPFGKPPYNRRWHVGVYIEHYQEPWVLHATNAQYGTRLQSLAEVVKQGHHFEAYLTWK